MVGDSAEAAAGSNALGLELYRSLSGGNRLLSPLSIHAALAMAFAGASDGTRDEMVRVLRISDGVHASFASLAAALRGAAGEGGTVDLANRIFLAKGYELRAAFLELIGRDYGALPESLDFKNASAAAQHINAWVARATHDKIRSLVSPQLLNDATGLVLANALYLRAGWVSPFDASTRDQEFFVGRGAPVRVPTMSRQLPLGYEAHETFEILALPFRSFALQFVIVLPRERDGLESVERTIDAGLLARAANMPGEKAIVHLPKFRLEPEALALAKPLIRLGLATTFDQPEGSASFDGIAPRRPDDYLFVSELMHKTFLAIDEEGVEAAAATALMMPQGASAPQAPPRILRVDRPFFFAVQHVASGACLFVGRVVDPRLTTCT